jgi:hypothetical protein
MKRSHLATFAIFSRHVSSNTLQWARVNDILIRGSLMVWRMHIVLKARQFVLITSLGNEGLVHFTGFIIGKLLKDLLRLCIFFLRVEISQFAPDLIDEVCTMTLGGELVHLEDHVRCCEVDTVGNCQSLIFLVLLDNALVLWYA